MTWEDVRVFQAEDTSMAPTKVWWIVAASALAFNLAEASFHSTPLTIWRVVAAGLLLGLGTAHRGYQGQTVGVVVGVLALIDGWRMLSKPEGTLIAVLNMCAIVSSLLIAFMSRPGRRG